jgi:hypothetical protein
MRTLASLGVVLACVVAGCETQDPAVKETQFCPEYAKRECAAVAPLCAASVAQCESVRLGACEARVAALKTAQYTARLFRPDNVNACLDKVRDTYGHSPLISGAALGELDAVCNRVFQGSAAMFEGCQVDYDCAGNLVCDPAKLRCGQKRVVPAGGQCANIGETCSAGEYCAPTGGAYLCARRAAKGAPCGLEVPCNEALLCVAAICVDKARSGDVCLAHSDCDTGYCSLSSQKCAAGLVFAEGTDACRLFLNGNTAVPDAGAP